MQFNLLAVILAVVVQFAIGFVWYGPLFGHLWGDIHGFNKLPKATQQKMMKGMGPFYALQLLVTIVTSVVLYFFLAYIPEWNAYAMAGFFWIGFVVPAQVSNVIFGGTEGKWVFAKILIQAGGSLLCLETATIVIKWML